MVCGLTSQLLENLHKIIMRSVAWPLQREIPFDCKSKCEMFMRANLFHMLVSMLVKRSPCFYIGRRDFDSFNTHVNSSQCLPDPSAVCRQKCVSTATMFSRICRCSHADIKKKKSRRGCFWLTCRSTGTQAAGMTFLSAALYTVVGLVSSNLFLCFSYSFSTDLTSTCIAVVLF